ncbi:MAG: hypothetical protein IH978_06315 [Nitrospinae bacterium]|nr:hypothetical protein [Nitrospinota bacterium]
MIDFNLEMAIGRKKDVEDIGVQGEIQKVMITSVVMRHFFIFPRASRACADFCDPTAISRFMIRRTGFAQSDAALLYFFATSQERHTI